MQRLIAILVSVSIILTGCASLQGVPVPRTKERAAVKVGERVEITTRGEGTKKFKVEEVTDEGLAGEGTRVAYADMTSLQVERSDPAHNGVVLWVLGGIVALGLLIWAVEQAGTGEVLEAGSGG